MVVTGASRGIGAALSRELVTQGARVTVLARSEQPLRALASEIGANPLAVDLGSIDGLGAAVKLIEHEAGPVDLLINNAALGEVGPFLEQSAESLQAHVNTNLLAPMQLCRLLLPGMIERGRGGVVTVSSLSSEISIRNMSTYVATKAGLSAFALNLQKELRRLPLRTMLVLLGEVQTDMVEQGRHDPVLSAIADRIGSMGSMTPDRVARDIVAGYQRGRRTLVLPPAARPIVELRQIPNRLFDLATRSIP